MQIQRALQPRLVSYLGSFPCVAILGPRQVGKTTLARMIMSEVKSDTVYLDLESDEDLQKVAYAEQYLTERMDKLIIIDEIQRKPELFPLLRSVIDKNRTNGRFILLGSASPTLLSGSSETLAGRIAYVELHPFSFREISSSFSVDELWLKGGCPGMFLGKNLSLSLESRLQFIRTYLERELPLMGLSASSAVLRNLLRMISGSQAQILNYASLSRSLGAEANTIKRYLDYFENAYLIRRIEPWFLNIKKRIVRSPKIYIRDTGILHALLNICTKEDLDGFHAKGFSWESFVVQQVIASLKPGIEPFFYRTQDGTELDLILVKGTRPVLGLEIKLTNAPTFSRSQTIASQDLGNIPLIIVTHSVSEDYNPKPNIQVVAFERLFNYIGDFLI